MTIVAGFKCFAGIVLVQTEKRAMGDFAKRRVPKLALYPKNGMLEARYQIAKLEFHSWNYLAGYFL